MARRRISATLARALRIGEPKERGELGAVDTEGGVERRLYMSSAVCFRKSSRVKEGNATLEGKKSALSTSRSCKVSGM
jgi:hypothetical protein